jgi:outer membrane protein TolC
MKRYTLIIILFILSFSTVAVRAQSLEEYLKIAAEENPLLKAKYVAFEAALQKVAQVKSLPDPTLSFAYFISPVETRVGPQQTKLGLTQMFPWFGTHRTAGNIHSLQAEARYQEFVDAKNELFMQVKSAWYPIYEVNRKISLQKENKGILGAYKRLATSGFKNSRNSMVDVIRVDIMIENVDVEIKLLQEQRKALFVRFNKLLNRDDTAFVQVPERMELITIPLNYRRDSLLLEHPTLAALDLKMKSAKEAELLSKKQGRPNWGLGLDYVFVGERSDRTVPDNGKDVIMPMLSITLPIFRAKYNAATKEAQLNQEMIAYYRTNMENTLIAKYESSWYDLEKSRELLDLYDTQILKTKQAIALLETAYSNSGEDFEEILRMQQELISFQLATANAMKDFYIALAKLDYYTSKTE